MCPGLGFVPLAGLSSPGLVTEDMLLPSLLLSNGVPLCIINEAHPILVWSGEVEMVFLGAATSFMIGFLPPPPLPAPYSRI